MIMLWMLLDFFNKGLMKLTIRFNYWLEERIAEDWV